MSDAEEITETQVDLIRQLVDRDSSEDYYRAANLALTVLNDTVGGSHPIVRTINDALEKPDWMRTRAAARAVVDLFDQGSLKSPRLTIAHEIEGALLDIAQTQASAAERNADSSSKQIQLAVAAFLGGAALEDALRRLADARGLQYDRQRTSLSKLQTVLYQPSNGIEVINNSENKQITVWGDTRNRADHGHFNELTQTDVVMMIGGVRAFIDKHLP